MKKLLIYGILGLVSGTTTSFSQGFIRLDNYDTDPSPLITYGYGVPANGVSGVYGTVGAGLNSSWTVGLYFASGAVAADTTEGNGPVSSTLNLVTGVGSTATLDPFSPDTLGQFFAFSGFNTGLPAGSTITVELVAYPTVAGSYAEAIYRAHSAAFNLITSIAINPVYSAAEAPFTVGSSMQSFAISAIPEPGTLALLGVGCVGLLFASNRQKA